MASPILKEMINLGRESVGPLEAMRNRRRENQSDDMAMSKFNMGMDTSQEALDSSRAATAEKQAVTNVMNQHMQPSNQTVQSDQSMKGMFGKIQQTIVRRKNLMDALPNTGEGMKRKQQLMAMQSQDYQKAQMILVQKRDQQKAYREAQIRESQEMVVLSDDETQAVIDKNPKYAGQSVKDFLRYHERRLYKFGVLKLPTPDDGKDSQFDPAGAVRDTNTLSEFSNDIITGMEGLEVTGEDDDGYDEYNTEMTSTAVFQEEFDLLMNQAPPGTLANDVAAEVKKKYKSIMVDEREGVFDTMQGWARLGEGENKTNVLVPRVYYSDLKKYNSKKDDKAIAKQYIEDLAKEKQSVQGTIER